MEEKRDFEEGLWFSSSSLEWGDLGGGGMGEDGGVQFKSSVTSSEFAMAGNDRVGFFVLGAVVEVMGKGEGDSDMSANRAAEASCTS